MSNEGNSLLGLMHPQQGLASRERCCSAYAGSFASRRSDIKGKKAKWEAPRLPVESSAA